MATFNNLQQFIDSIKSRFDMPPRSLRNEGLKKETILNSMLDLAAYVGETSASEYIKSNLIEIEDLKELARKFAEKAESYSNGTVTTVPSGTPVESISIYNVSSAGTYTNFGGIVVSEADLSSGLVQIRSVAGSWMKMITPVSTGSSLLISSNSGTSFFSENGLYEPGGGFVPSANWRSGSIPLPVSGKINYSCFGAVGANAISFFDASGHYISGVAFTGTTKSGEIQPPINATVAKVTTQLVNLLSAYADYSTVFASGNASVAYLGAELNKKALAGYHVGQKPKTLAEVDAAIGRMISVKTTFPEDGFYPSNGTYNPVVTWGSITIPIKSTSVTYSLYSVTGARLLTFFDSANIVLGFLSANITGFHTGEIVPPVGTVKMTASYSRANGAGSYVQYLEDVAPEVVKIQDSIAANKISLNNKADAGYLPGQPVKTLAEVQAMINVVKIKHVIFSTDGFYSSAGIYNPVATWGSTEVWVIPSKTISYNLYSLAGARLITFYNAAGSEVGVVNASSSGIAYNTGLATVPAAAVRATISASRVGTGSYIEYETEVNKWMEATQKNITPKVTGVTLKVSKSLVANNTTIFNSISAAFTAWRTGDIIKVYEGVYEEFSLNIPDGVYVKGIGSVEVRGYTAPNAPTSQVDARSTFDFLNSGTLENLKITCQNMRYPVHSDFGNPSYTQKLINCELIHHGNSEVYQYRIANASMSPNSALDTWRVCSALGMGTMSGSRIYALNCKFQSPMRAFSTHNNTDYHLTDGSSAVQCDNCEMITEGIDLNGSQLPFKPAICVQSLSSYTNDTVIFNNCIVNGVIALQSSSQDYREFTHQIGGSGTNHLMQVRHTTGSGKTMTYQTDLKSVFLIKVTSSSADEIMVSGNMVESIFGQLKKLTGLGMNSWVKGQVGHVSVIQKVNAYVGSKTITFTSGADSKVITLNNSYSTATEFVADLNQKFGAASFVASLYWPGLDWWPKFANEVGVFTNAGTTSIFRGRAVKKVGTKGVALMTSSDAPSDFAGIALEDMPIAKLGSVKFKGYMLKIWVDGLEATSLSNGDKIQVNADGKLNKSSDGSGVIVSSCIENENISINI